MGKKNRFQLFLWLLYPIHFLPLFLLYWIAWPIGRLAYVFLKGRKHIGQVNLALCFPEKSPEERRKILKANFHHMAVMFLEYSIAWYTSPKRIRRLVVYEGKDWLKKAEEQAIPLTVFYPHFSALELGALRLNLDYPIISIFAEQRNSIINQKIYEGRTRFHKFHPVYLQCRTKKLVSIFQKLKHSDALFLYLSDQDFGAKNSVFVPFFNLAAATNTGLSRLSRISGRKVLPIVPIRQKNQIRLKVFPILDNFPSDDVVDDMQRINQFLEEIIRQYPEQYFWLHKRFKTRPGKEKSVY
ncbi:MAG: lipid A biosynthesis lauroyl acyltransferase [Neisseriaceae bacterium]